MYFEIIQICYLKTAYTTVLYLEIQVLVYRLTINLNFIQTNSFFSSHVTPIPSNLSPTPPQYPVASLVSSTPARRRVTPLMRTSYPLPAPPEKSERPRTAPLFRHRQKPSEGRHRTQVTRTTNISENQEDNNLGESRVSSALANSCASQRYCTCLTITNSIKLS